MRQANPNNHCSSDGVETFEIGAAEATILNALTAA